MSTTVQTSPASYTPCYNGQWFVATSTQTAQTNFTYTVVVTDMITLATATYEIEQRPDAKLAFDGENFAQNYIDNFIPNNEYGWFKCTDAIRQIRVNIGETYGSTPAYASGANNDYYVWNSAEAYLVMPDYDQTDYVYKGSTTNYKYLTSYRNPITETNYKPHYVAYDDRSQFLYALTSEDGDLEAIRVVCYDINGSQIQSTVIDNPYAPGTTYTDKYVCIDIGRKGLDNLASGDVFSGSYPIIPSNCDYYEIEDVTINGDEPPYSYTVRKIIQRLYLPCEPRHTVYTLHFLDKEGNFETIHFPKVSEINIDAEKSYFRRNPYEMVSNVWNYDPFKPNEVVLNSSATKRIRLNTDWVTEAQCEAWQYVVNAMEVYLDLGSNTTLVPVKVMTNSFKINKKWNERLYSLTLDIQFTFKENYQHG